MHEEQPGRAEPADEVPVRIVLVDDHAILRQGLRSLLEREHDLQVVGEASSAGEALAAVERTRPAIVLLDMKLSPASDNDGLGVCARLTKRYPELSVLVLSTFVDDALVVSAIQHGASGFVVKDIDTLELVRSIRLVARKGSAFDSRSAAAMTRSIHAPGTLTADRPRAERAEAGRKRLEQPGHRRAPAPVGDHGEIPRPQHHAQARRDQPRRGGLQGHQERPGPDVQLRPSRRSAPASRRGARAPSSGGRCCRPAHQAGGGQWCGHGRRRR